MARHAWLTPDDDAAGYITRRLLIPNSLPIVMAVNGAIASLADVWNWEQHGSMTPEETAEVMNLMVLDYFQSGYSYLLGIPFPFLTENPPPHSLELNGQTITDAETDYPALWAVIDPSLKSGSDIVLPDYRGRFLVGAGGAYSLGDTGGSESVTLTVDELPPHAHGVIEAGPSVTTVGLEPPEPTAVPAPGLTDSAGGGAAHENRPPFIGVRWAVWVN